MSKQKKKSKQKPKVKTSIKKYDIVDTATGEIVNALNYGDKILRKESSDFIESTLVINPKEEFVKVFIKPLLKLSLMLSNSEAVFMTYLLSHLEYTSCILKTNNDEILTIDYIVKEINLKERAVYGLIKKLVDHGILAKIETEGVKCFAMNPFVFHRGKRVSKEIIEVFRHTQWVKIFQDEEKVYELSEVMINGLQ